MICRLCTMRSKRRNASSSRLALAGQIVFASTNFMRSFAIVTRTASLRASPLHKGCDQGFVYRVQKGIRAWGEFQKLRKVLRLEENRIRLL